MKGSFTIKKVSLSLFCLLLYKLSFAQLLAWDFSTKTGTVSGPIVATANHPDLEISSLSRGANLGESNYNYSYFSAYTADCATKADAISKGSYYFFTIKSKIDYKFSLATLDAKIRRNTNGPGKIQWQYKVGVDGEYIDLAPEATLGTTTDGEVQPQIDLSAVSALQNVLPSSQITFRLLGWGAKATGGFAIGRIANSTQTGNSLAIGGLTTLPVTIQSFTAKKENNFARLNWATASEINNSHFEVLHSTDGKKFSVIGTVPGHGTVSQPKFYSYSHADVVSGNNYYKLRQVDFNGNSHESSVTSVKIGFEKPELKASSSENHVNIYVSLIEKSNAVLKIGDINGRQLHNQSLNLEAGVSYLNVPLTLSPGVYVVSIYTKKGQQIHSKFIK